MSRPNFLVLVSLLMLVPQLRTNAQSSEYVIEIQPGKKVLNVQNLDLPSVTCLGDLLDIFPELLARDGDSKLANYDVQVNDFSLGGSKETVLKYLKLSDIKSIEVSANPSTSQQKNGQGGLVKVKLKDTEEGFSGKVMAVASTAVDIAPSVTLNYKKGPWTISSSAVFEYYHPQDNISRRETVFTDRRTYQSDTSRRRDAYEFISLDVKYNPTSRDSFHLWGWEDCSGGKGNVFSDVVTNSVRAPLSSEENDKQFGYYVALSYAHTFPQSKLETEWTVSGSPEKYQLLKYRGDAPTSLNFWRCDTGKRGTNLTGLLKYKYSLVPVGEKNKADWIVGANVRYNPASLSYDFEKNGLVSQSDYHQGVTMNSNTSFLYLSPYIETDNAFGHWFFKGGVRFQHYSNLIDVKEVEYSSFSLSENYVTAFLNAGYQIAPHHHLSMILDRSIQRPSNASQYPYEIYDPSVEYFVVGNPNLKPLSIHSATLNYITDFKRGDNSFTFDVELKYINTNNLIQKEKGPEVIAYKNDGSSDIAALNFQFLYLYRTFSLAFTSNVFENFTDISEVKDHYMYYNLSVVPSLRFNDGWAVSAKFTYNSNIYTKTTRLSDYIYAETRFSKTWGKWTAYMELLDNFHKVAEDRFYGKAISEALYYNLYRPSFRLGVNLNF